MGHRFNSKVCVLKNMKNTNVFLFFIDTSGYFERNSRSGSFDVKHVTNEIFEDAQKEYGKRFKTILASLKECSLIDDMLNIEYYLFSEEITFNQKEILSFSINYVKSLFKGRKKVFKREMYYSLPVDLD